MPPLLKCQKCTIFTGLGNGRLRCVRSIVSGAKPLFLKCLIKNFTVAVGPQRHSNCCSKKHFFKPILDGKFGPSFQVFFSDVTVAVGPQPLLPEYNLFFPNTTIFSRIQHILPDYNHFSPKTTTLSEYNHFARILPLLFEYDMLALVQPFLTNTFTFARTQPLLSRYNHFVPMQPLLKK